MKVRGMRELRRAGRWLRSRGRQGGLILLYHRVAEEEVDPFDLCVTPERFAAQMRLLRQRAHPLPLGTFLRHLATGTLPAHAVAVTFDDGYADNWTTALPILAEQEIPATVFAIAGELGRPFWWEALTEMILTPARLPDHLALPGLLPPTQVPDAPAQRRPLFGRLHAQLNRLDVSTRREVLDGLGEWSGVAAPCRGAAVSAEWLAQETAWLAVGAHTQTHSRLAGLAVERQQAEIAGGKAMLEQITGRSITHFSYPFGLADDFDATSVRLVREAGFTAACTNLVDLAHAGSDPLRLPRLWVKNWPAETLWRRLQRWW